MPDSEIDKLLEDVAEVKELLLCRILPSLAALLPAAARAKSVDEFLNNKNVDSAHLRDLCLELENPGLQEVRDACADLVRGDDSEDTHSSTKIQDVEISTAKKDQTKDKTKDWMRSKPATENKPKRWMPKSVLEQRQRRYRQNEVMKHQGEDDEDEVSQLNFDIEDGSTIRNERMRVQICGRYICNHPSEDRMSRGCWLQFCIIAKDSDLSEAIKLCRSWDEFYELNTPAAWQYFPRAKWLHSGILN